MAERSIAKDVIAKDVIAKDVGHLGLGAGEELRGEGILAIAMARPQSGVGDVVGYQGAPILHPMDALANAQDILADLGVRFAASAPAAMLAASMRYPIRGTNVAADALAGLAACGVAGGALLIEALKGARVRA
jgi:indolepyruvate ferredoxin oxidoreductase, alpha subunit